MGKTKIEWSEKTWNPVLGCSRISHGCDNCYAISQSHRISAQQAGAGNESAYLPPLTVKPDDGSTDWTGELRMVPDRLHDPLRWTQPTKVFVNSMSDLFHVDILHYFQNDVFGIMASTPRHTYQVLTKRSKHMRDTMPTIWRDIHHRSYGGKHLEVTEPPANIWLGVSVESEKYKFRIDHLRETPAAVRFLSIEPLLGPLDELDLTGIDQVIVGGESGPKARPMHPDWAREIRDQCIEQDVPFFFKQWGNWRLASGLHASPHEVWVDPDDGTSWEASQALPHMEPMRRERSKNFDGHDLLDGVEWKQYPGDV